MIYVKLLNEDKRKLSFYLAMEEYVARKLPPGDYFFMWQVEPTVIFGRNQLIESEVDMEYCKNNNIETYRRKSGGGCVYADRSNIMFSYITPDANVNFTFNRYMLMVEHVLHKLGLDAKSTGRNDILIDGKKVSGNAFYHLPDRSIVHGTMLYDTDIEKMVRSTTPSDAKLKSKGVQSVRQHVTTLNRYLSIGIEEFKDFVRENLCDEYVYIDEHAVAEITEIEKEYLSDGFIYGCNPAGSIVGRKHFPGVGEFEIRLEVKSGVVRKADILGDYFLVGDIGGALISRLRGVPYEQHAILAAVSDIEPRQIIMNMTKEQLVELIKTLF